MGHEMISGRGGDLAFGKETTFKTKATPTISPKFTEFSGGIAYEVLIDESRTGRRAGAGSQLDTKSGQLNLSSNLDPENAGLLFKALLGVEAVDLVDGELASYEHIFTPALVGAALPSWTIQRKYVAKTLNALGCVLNTLSLDLSAKAFVQVQAGFLVSDETVEGSPTTVSKTALAAFVFRNAIVKINTAAFPSRQLSMSFNNNLVEDDFRSDGSGTRYGISTGQFSAEGNLSVVWNSESDALREIWRNDQYFSLELELDSGVEIATGESNYLIRIVLPRCKFRSGEIGTEVEGMLLPLPFDVFDDDADGPVRVTLVNSRATAY